MRAARTNWRRQRTVLCTVLVPLAVAGILSLHIGVHRPLVEHRSGKPLSAEVLPPNLLRPISPQAALRENAGKSFSLRRDSAALPFKFVGDSVTRERALKCLTQAVYYEAASDGPEAERAVAQVVLNRVRHPGYPSSICGVVYEGSEHAGCQFTFACDGSLARPPVTVLWKQAQKVAGESLSGKVFAPVGHATHYHADYVLPYWADSLDKSVQIGQQIFYRLKGDAGGFAAFSQRYSNRESPPSLQPLNPFAVATDAANSAASVVVESNDSVLAARPNAIAQRNSDLIVDGTRPVLIADVHEGVATKNYKRAQAARSPGDSCQYDPKPKEVRALVADDDRTNRSVECP